MSSSIVDPFDLNEEQLRQLLFINPISLPELETARHNRAALRASPLTQLWLDQTREFMQNVEQIPLPTYTQYRLFRRTGDRAQYQRVEWTRRSRLSISALRLFLIQEQSEPDPSIPFTPDELKDIVQNYIWTICEESNWIWPAHEHYLIDLASAELGLVLAQAVQSRVLLEQDARSERNQEAQFLVARCLPMFAGKR